jgi:excisionase family DNA binding protein
MYMNKKFIQIKEASLLLGVSRLTLRNWDKSGRLKAHRHPINNYRVYIYEDVDNILNKTEMSLTNRKKEENNKIYKLKVIHMND